MFGYIRPLKSELKLKEYNAYRSVYCGFCHALGKAGPFLRLSLSYDFTFFSILALSLDEEFCGFCQKRCPVKPFKKYGCVKDNEKFEYAAALSIMMLYEKANDNLSDREHILSSLLLKGYLKKRYRKAADKYKEEAQILTYFTKNQKEAEKNFTSLDSACHSTADTLSKIFSKLSKNQNKSELLSRLGYNLGRWVYLIDALDDLEGDLKKGRFNPLILRFKGESDLEKIKDFAKGELSVSASMAGDCIEALELYNFSPIIENIVYFGLYNMQKAVLSKSRKERKLIVNG